MPKQSRGGKYSANSFLPYFYKFSNYEFNKFSQNVHSSMNRIEDIKEPMSSIIIRRNNDIRYFVKLTEDIEYTILSATKEHIILIDLYGKENLILFELFDDFLRDGVLKIYIKISDQEFYQDKSFLYIDLEHIVINPTIKVMIDTLRNIDKKITYAVYIKDKYFIPDVNSYYTKEIFEKFIQIKAFVPLEDPHRIIPPNNIRIDYTLLLPIEIYAIDNLVEGQTEYSFDMFDKSTSKFRFIRTNPRTEYPLFIYIPTRLYYELVSRGAITLFDTPPHTGIINYRGGKQKKISSKTKTTEKFIYNKRKYTIYIGKRGGKYIIIKKELISIKKLI